MGLENKPREGRAAQMAATSGCTELGRRPREDPHIRWVRRADCTPKAPRSWRGSSAGK